VETTQTPTGGQSRLRPRFEGPLGFGASAVLNLGYLRFGPTDHRMILGIILTVLVGCGLMLTPRWSALGLGIIVGLARAGTFALGVLLLFSAIGA
jgi:hypothetical protein